MAFGALIAAGVGMMASENASSASSKAARTSAKSANYAADIQKDMYDQTRQDQGPWRGIGQNALYKLAGMLGLGNPYSRFYGMSRDQLRAELLPSYAKQVEQKGAPQNLSDRDRYGMPESFGSLYTLATGDDYIPPPTQYTTQIDENGLNAQIDEILNGLQGWSPESADNGALLRDFSMADYQEDPGYQFRMDQGQKALERSAAARGGLYSGRAMKDMDRFSQGLASDEYQNAFNRFQSNQSNKFNRLASMAGVGQTANNALAANGANYANSLSNIYMTSGANQSNAALAGAAAMNSAYGGMGRNLQNVNWGKLFNNNNGSGSSYTDTSWDQPAQSGTADYSAEPWY